MSCRYRLLRAMVPHLRYNLSYTSYKTGREFKWQGNQLFSKDKFLQYHHKMAQLRVIKAEQNLSLGGSERIGKSRNPVLIPKELLGD